MAWLQESFAGEIVYTALMSMAPVVELRGGLPFGVSLGLPVWVAFCASVVGNMIPVPFIIVYIRSIFAFMRKKMPKFNSLVDKLETKAHLKGNLVTKYRFLGLCILVAIPLPGTGAWTGALVAAFMDMRLRDSVPAIALGVVIAGLIISLLTFGVTAMFA